MLPNWSYVTSESSGAPTLLSIKNGSLVLNANLPINVSPPNTVVAPKEGNELRSTWNPVSIVSYVYICPHWLGIIFLIDP